MRKKNHDKIVLLAVLGVDNNSSSSHTDNRKNSFLVLGEGSTDGINDGTGAAEDNSSIKFTKENTKFFLRLHYNGDESYLYVNITKICKFKAKDNIGWYDFCLESISRDFTKDEQSELSGMVLYTIWFYLKNVYQIIN